MKLNNLFYNKGKTNWAAVVLVSAMIGALTSWVIIFMSESILEISAPDSLRKNETNVESVVTPAVKTNSPAIKTVESDSGVCGTRITGREPNAPEKQQCEADGGEVICGTISTDYVNQPGTSENFCDCLCQPEM